MKLRTFGSLEHEKEWKKLEELTSEMKKFKKKNKFANNLSLCSDLKMNGT